jgi:hypothetical protein
MPVDPVSDGTWIAVNDAGLVLVLLNVTPLAGAAPGRRSRGAIIPGLLASDSLAAAARQTGRLNPAEFAPFRLVLIRDDGVAEVYWDGVNRTDTPPEALTNPRMFTSSGLGDPLVERPRQRSFEEFVAIGFDPAAQDAFHRHRWPGREHLSVCMSRPDARTVSFTIIEIGADAATMAYSPEAPDRGVSPTVARLPLHAEAAR